MGPWSPKAAARLRVGLGLTRTLSRGEKDSFRTQVSPDASLRMGFSRTKGPLGFSTEYSSWWPSVKDGWQVRGRSPSPDTPVPLQQAAWAGYGQGYVETLGGDVLDGDLLYAAVS